MAGSSVGISYGGSIDEDNPGIVFPPNLTPDPETGIGAMTDTEVAQLIRTGIDPHGRYQLTMMPWTAYSTISDVDATAIIAYLRSLPPVYHQVPADVGVGQRSGAPYVHFGVFTHRP